MEGGIVKMNTITYPSFSQGAAGALAMEDGCTDGSCGVVVNNNETHRFTISNLTTLENWYNANYAGKTKAGTLKIGSGGKAEIGGNSTFNGISNFNDNVYFAKGFTLTEAPEAKDQVSMALNPAYGNSNKYSLEILRGPVMGRTIASGLKVANAAKGSGAAIWVPPQTLGSTIPGCQLQQACLL
jgi:hypothetical protein